MVEVGKGSEPTRYIPVLKPARLQHPFDGKYHANGKLSPTVSMIEIAAFSRRSVRRQVQGSARGDRTEPELGLGPLHLRRSRQRLVPPPCSSTVRVVKWNMADAVRATTAREGGLTSGRSSTQYQPGHIHASPDRDP